MCRNHLKADKETEVHWRTLFLPSAPSDSNTMEVWGTKRCRHCLSSVTPKREMIIERNSTFPCFAFVLQISAFFWKIYIQINIKKKSGDSRSWSFQDSLVLSCICTGFYSAGTLSLASFLPDPLHTWAVSPTGLPLIFAQSSHIIVYLSWPRRLVFSAIIYETVAEKLNWQAE